MFQLGQVVATPAVLKAIASCEQTPLQYILRHQRLEAGELGEEDQRLNKQALDKGERVLSAYLLPTKEKVYVITEWDRSYTTLMLASEY